MQNQQPPRRRRPMTPEERAMAAERRRQKEILRRRAMRRYYAFLALLGALALAALVGPVSYTHLLAQQLVRTVQPQHDDCV